jgi:hypothetical protein
MEAIKQILKIKNEKITLHFNSEMNDTRVEVIILPIMPKKTKRDVKKRGLAELLKIGVWTAKDTQIIEKASQIINQWTIQKF